MSKENKMNLYVGNLANKTNENELKKAFEAFGEVSSASVIKDRFTNESKGFGFVDMPSKTEAQAAMDELNGTELVGQNIAVSQARPRSEKKGSHGSRRDGHNRRRNF
jgi:RNA recognition motif-containing protein